MAEITQSEFFESLLLTLLERDEEIVLVDDPSPPEDDEESEDLTSEAEEVLQPGDEGFEEAVATVEPEASPVVDGAPEAEVAPVVDEAAVAEGPEAPADSDPASLHPSEPADSEQG